MNELLPRPRREPTQAAEGLPRWRWTVDDLDRLIEAGVLTEEDRVELIGGELVPMAAKGIRHENLRAQLENWVHRTLPSDLWLVVELGWRPDGETYCEPDLLVIPAGFMPVSKVPAAEVRLLIEVADTTLKYDMRTKASLYARLGVRDYWVVNADTLETRVHREPTAHGYRQTAEMPPQELLAPLLVPAIALRLQDLVVS